MYIRFMALKTLYIILYMKMRQNIITSFDTDFFLIRVLDFLGLFIYIYITQSLFLLESHDQDINIENINTFMSNFLFIHICHSNIICIDKFDHNMMTPTCIICFCRWKYFVFVIYHTFNNFWKTIICYINQKHKYQK